MNKLTITPETVKIEIAGWDKIWSFKGKLIIPRKSVTKVSLYDRKLWPPFFRCPGTALPGVIIAGTYYGVKKKEFWNIRPQKPGIVLDLQNFNYTRVAISIDNPEKIITELQK